MSLPTYLVLCQVLPNTPNLDLLNPLTTGKIIFFSHFRMLIHSSHNIYTFHTMCMSIFSKQCSHSTYIFFYTNKHKTQNYIQSVSIMLDVARKKKKNNANTVTYRQLKKKCKSAFCGPHVPPPNPTTHHSHPLNFTHISSLSFGRLSLFFLSFSLFSFYWNTHTLTR